MSQSYDVTLKNNSSMPWTFYIYQQRPDHSGSEVFSLAWFVSPFTINPQTRITFSWTMDYGFVCGVCESVRPGSRFRISDEVRADLDSNNSIRLSYWDNEPQLSNPIMQRPSGKMTVHSDSIVPSKSIAVGISVGGSSAFVTATGPNLTHTFTPAPVYWIAAGNNVGYGSILDTATIKQNAKIEFPPNSHSLTYSLGQDNQWTQD